MIRSKPEPVSRSARLAGRDAEASNVCKADPAFGAFLTAIPAKSTKIKALVICLAETSELSTKFR
jgi:hypothetical protein